jgi:hypothetical protein
MAAGTWNVYKNAKRQIGRGAVAFQTRALRITLHSQAFSAHDDPNLDFTTVGSLTAELNASNGYAGNGLTISNAGFTLTGTNVKYSGNEVFWSANGGNLGGGTIQFAVVHISYSGGTRFPFMFVTLSTSPFLVGDGSRLTINSSGAKYFEIQ